MSNNSPFSQEQLDALYACFDQVNLEVKRELLALILNLRKNDGAVIQRLIRQVVLQQRILLSKGLVSETELKDESAATMAEFTLMEVTDAELVDRLARHKRADDELRRRLAKMDWCEPNEQ